MKNTLESTIERKVCKDALHNLGIISIKLKLDADSAWPDRMFLIPGGRPLFIEFKQRGETPNEKQFMRIEKLKMLGYDAYFCDNYTDAMTLIRRHLDCARKEMFWK